MIVVWNDAVKHAKLEECTENKNGWWNTVMLESNRKILAILKVCRIVDANSTSANSCKARCERKGREIKRAKDIRAEMFQELEQEIKEKKQ